MTKTKSPCGNGQNLQPLLAWHYTTGRHFAAIVETGMLRPSAQHIAKGESPILWFSLEQYWEPTAQKAVRENGDMISVGMLGTYEKGMGLVRFGVYPSRLVPWPRLAKQACIPSGLRRGLERSGRAQGAVPEHWYGLVGEPLPVSDVDAIDRFDGKNWVRIPD